MQNVEKKLSEKTAEKFASSLTLTLEKSILFVSLNTN